MRFDGFQLSITSRAGGEFLGRRVKVFDILNGFVASIAENIEGPALCIKNTICPMLLTVKMIITNGALIASKPNAKV